MATADKKKSHRKKPLIGVSGPDKGGKILWLFTKLGVVLGGGKARRITANRSDDPSRFDGFIIAGGGDINPELYGESAALKDLQYDEPRDKLEQHLVRYAFDNHIPLLGICRGMQMMNVTLGGSLYQEAKDILEDFLPSQSLISKFIGRREVTIDKKSTLFGILGSYEQYNVNSIHHQAVNKLGKGLSVVAREENQLIQAIEQTPDNQHPFLIGIQWHPELMLHAASARRLFKSLVKAAD